jgi:hypothetical protein
MSENSKKQSAAEVQNGASPHTSSGPDARYFPRVYPNPQGYYPYNSPSHYANVGQPGYGANYNLGYMPGQQNMPPYSPSFPMPEAQYAQGFGPQAMPQNAAYYYQPNMAQVAYGGYNHPHAHNPASQANYYAHGMQPATGVNQYAQNLNPGYSQLPNTLGHNPMAMYAQPWQGPQHPYGGTAAYAQPMPEVSPNYGAQYSPTQFGDTNYGQPNGFNFQAHNPYGNLRAFYLPNQGWWWIDEFGRPVAPAPEPTSNNDSQNERR